MHWTGYISHPYLHTVHSTSTQLLTIYSLILKLEIGRLNSANILKNNSIDHFCLSLASFNKKFKCPSNARENYTTSNITSVLTRKIYIKTADKIKLDSVPEGFYIFDGTFNL